MLVSFMNIALQVFFSAGGGTGTAGTSGGVSAVHNIGYKRLHPHNPHGRSARGQGGNSGGGGGDCNASGDGASGTGSGGNGSGSVSGHYKAPLLTEELLLVHNRGMEQKMIEHYKDTKKGEE